ncbi:MAG: serine hydrolase [Cytophagales bacterium]|nr:serine hydrolase [Cytophagales bacterium]
MHRKISSFFFLILSISSLSFAQNNLNFPRYERTDADKWVDSVFYTMTPEERLGQLFMVAAYSNRTEKHYKEIDSLIKKYNIGGLIFFQGGPVREAQLTNRYQKNAKVPLMIGMDAEWGLAMRLDSTVKFPRQVALGALKNDTLIYQMGEEIARHCKRLGIHVNFAPVVDVNVNPENPVIGTRSFGENKYKVAQKGIAYMKGMQAHHVMANAKHFPGHGDTDTDSHHALPIITHDKKRIEDIELYPFRELMKDSLASVMVAHIHMPTYDKRENIATTLSENVVHKLLKNDLGFKGLVFTDALNMKGVSKFHEPGEVDLKALLAGNDVLLFPMNVPKAISHIQEAIKKGQITEEEVNARIRKILYAKHWSGLHKQKFVELENLYEDLNTPEAYKLRRELYKQSLTVAKNDSNFLPIQVIDTNTFASVCLNSEDNSTFQQMLSKYAKFEHHSLRKNELTKAKLDAIYEKVKDKKVVVLGLHKLRICSKCTRAFNKDIQDFIDKLSEKTTVVAGLLGNPYNLKHLDKVNSVIAAYDNNLMTQELVPQLIFGAFGVDAILPVTASEEFKEGQGFKVESLNRLSYDLPASQNMSAKTLQQIDAIAQEAIEKQATPGCQVLVVKNGTVVFDKSYGYYTYNKEKLIQDTSLYDIASVTKVLSTLQAVMFLVDQGDLNVDKKMSFYLKDLKGTNKGNLIIKDVLLHQAGLVPFIPHWKKVVNEDGTHNATYLAPQKSDTFNQQVTEKLYSISTIEDSLWKWTVDSELRNKKFFSRKYEYKYSDLTFYLLKKLVEEKLNQSLEDFMSQNFYMPLGAYSTRYNPLQEFPKSRIVPTAYDQYFRKKQLQGTVHDEGAALLGGVGGHAGIFSNANDLAKICQMNLQNGTYGGLDYLSKDVLEMFTEKQNDKNRRGLGWDKPAPKGLGPTSIYSSPRCFGHTGFTGTCVWMDPDYDLVYIFLSNRIYLDAENRKLLRLDIRTRIHDVIYQSMMEFHEN